MYPQPTLQFFLVSISTREILGFHREQFEKIMLIWDIKSFVLQSMFVCAHAVGVLSMV